MMTDREKKWFRTGMYQGVGVGSLSLVLAQNIFHSLPITEWLLLAAFIFIVGGIIIAPYKEEVKE